MERTDEEFFAFRWGGEDSPAPGMPLEMTHAGALPPAVQILESPGTKTVKEIVSGGRTLGRVFEDAEAKYLLVGGVTGSGGGTGREETLSAFSEFEKILAENGMTFRNVVRTWLYIDKVCDWYDEFNAARSEFFDARDVFATFLPASTGIGCPNRLGARLALGGLAMLPKADGVRAEVVESPLQEPAMAYKSSFSRASEIITPTMRQLFISGTASIEPHSHEVAHVGDPAKQIECTMKAVHAILESRGYGYGDVTRATAYIKRPEYVPMWREWLKSNGLPADFATETICDVCRDEWLFELECDAVRGGPRKI